MRILVDESVNPKLERELADLSVSTVRTQSWLGLRNGVLLRAAADAGFDVLITRDQSMRFQQNLEKLGIAVIVVTGVRNRIDDLRMLTSQIRSILPYLRPGDAYDIAPLKGDVICDAAA
ncbi:MAG TPA: hypothetical protein VJ853_10900 [Thermoanaerobaculia bacterium]|nr:hypothetical protein [Thermoanaerobaculia bacterium]